jgi:hypothetical protein
MLEFFEANVQESGTLSKGASKIPICMMQESLDI